MRSFIASSSALAAVTLAGAALAGLMVLIPAGATVSLAGTTHAEDATLGGANVEERLLDFECSDGSGTLKGKLTTFVMTNGASSLDFYYRVHNDAGSTLPVTELTAGTFPESKPGQQDGVYVEFRPDALGVSGPKNAERSSDGKEITFLFTTNGAIQPGQSSLPLLVRPSRGSYDDNGSVLVSDGVRTCVVSNTMQPL
jgi:hypothetical protein